ncbi:hypothetical protein [Chroococcidiopsis cubana]|nr:hypothetical protein [Chroococcidiopsis cubana]
MKAIVFDQVTERYRVSLGLGGSVPLASRRDRAAWVQALTKIALC